MAKIQDDVIDVIKNDIEKLRTKPHMYISHTGKKGAIHLAKEATNNAIDEAINEHSLADRIDIEIDENLNTFTIEDNGRGIQLDKVEELCTYLQSGSNLHKESGNRKTMTRKAGDHGVGLTAINAFSKKLVIVSYQYTIMQKGIFVFEDGKLTSKTIKPYTDKSKHGTTISFDLDERYMKTDKFDTKDYREWLNDISYLLPKKVKLYFSVVKKGKRMGTSEKMYHKNGILDKLDTMVSDQIIKPIRITKSFNEGDFLDIAITYSEDDLSDFGNHESFCNWIHTIEDGEHVKAFKAAWCQVTSKLTSDYMTENEKKKYPITFEDCRQGLCAVINLVCLFPDFTGQTKQEVGNDELYKPIVKAVSEELKKYFKSDSNAAKKIAAIIKRNAKARIEVRKIKKSEFKKMDSFEEIKLDGYYPCYVDDPTKAEIFITEGKSAGGSVTGNRDKRYQAVLYSKGNPKNIYGLTIPQILENEEMRKFFKIGGAGIGPTFNIRKFRFAKVILFVDSDIDAYNMMSLWSAGFLWAAPDIVKEGRLYRTQAPLYLIKDKKNPYILSKRDYYDLFANIVAKNYEMIDAKGHSLSTNEIRKLIELNDGYLEEIQSLEKYLFADSEIFEFIVYNGEKDLIKNFKKKFPETDYDKNSNILSTIYKGSRFSVTLDDDFYSKCERLHHMISDLNMNDIYFNVIDNGVAIDGVKSLGSFFKMSAKYLPEVVKRFKGVGELPDKVLWDTVLNPEKRRLIRLTCDDLEKELSVVNMLHGKNSDLRKEFMKDYHVNPDDLDT